MMARRVGRKPKPAPITLPGAMGRQIVTAAVDDPMEWGKKRDVEQVVTSSPLSYLLHRDRLHKAPETLEDGYRRYEAGQRMRLIYERGGGRGAGAIDYAKTKVDVSLRYEGAPESQTRALHEMAVIHRKLGDKLFWMLHAICCEETSFFKWLRVEWPVPGRLTKLEAYADPRAGLDALIEHFGVARGRERGRIVGIRSVSCET